jgi:hypothetical protein
MIRGDDLRRIDEGRALRRFVEGTASATGA